MQDFILVSFLYISLWLDFVLILQKRIKLRFYLEIGIWLVKIVKISLKIESKCIKTLRSLA